MPKTKESITIQDVEVGVEKVMDRKKVADSLHAVLDAGVELLGKESFEARDFGRIKVIRTLGTHMNAAVAMVQQENSQVRAVLIAQRMKQLGYGGESKQIEG